MSKEQMLYIMGVDWDWIHQRPQIIAEKLSDNYRITAVFPRSVTSLKLKKPNHSDIDFRILWTLPYQEKNTLIGKLSKLINRNVFKDLAQYQYIYIGYPLYARYVPEYYKGSIIYDCMDNYDSLYPDFKNVSKVIVQEKNLIQRCDLLFASSKMLQQKVDAIAGFKKSKLVRNGTDIYKVYDIKQAIVKARYSLGYIGTISHWFDFCLIENSLKIVQNINYSLIGPIDTKKKCIDKIIYYGAIPHEKLWETIENCDCLIMPFCINDIILYVDPVKLYEYIAFGKCIISIYYPEIERFRDFVYFYETETEYINLLLKLSKEGFPPKYNNIQRQLFLNNNTWEKRCKIINEEIAR